MKYILNWTIGTIFLGAIYWGLSVNAQTSSSLFLAYPDNNYKTQAEQIFLIGTAAREGEVLINGKPIQRSQFGHFAPSFPLKLGENVFTLRYNNEQIQVKVTRLENTPKIPVGVGFTVDSLTPKTDIARLPGELICFSAIAPPNSNVSVRLKTQTIPLFPQSEFTLLAPGSAILNSGENISSVATFTPYQGCITVAEIGNLGQPVFQLNLEGKTITETAVGQVQILSQTDLEVIEVIAEAGVTRTGPGTDYSRLTPLPKGTKASVTGTEGEWLRLDYGAWIQVKETKKIANAVPPISTIRSIFSRQVSGATEIVFPLQVSVPIRIQQGEKTFTLTLYNTIAQTDTIRLGDDPVIKRLDWQQITPNQIEYTFHLKSEQQWGYDVAYKGSNLILSLRHPPKVSSSSLSGIRILLDPGHGGSELGSRGPTGYPEKAVNLAVSLLLEQELKKLGATVYMTRETDVEVSLENRVGMINDLKPDLSFSIHYNALPDDGDAINTQGIGVFWYHPQAHNLAVFLQHYLVEKLNRPSYGLFWNNLALTRPHRTPSLLLELGFMINPEEFAWIINTTEQQKLAQILAQGIQQWLFLNRE
jgi:N-acetylmuramoyl-L-alanine amidase